MENNEESAPLAGAVETDIKSSEATKTGKAAGKKSAWSGVICLVVVFGLFGYLGQGMGLANMLKTLMNTAHDLLLNTVFYLMAICVLTGAVGKIFMEFGVVDLLERLLRPLMKPLFNLPGVASLGAVVTFLSDNPAIISLASDKRFSSYFKKYQFISLTNFGTAFGMGLLVMVFMVGQGYFWEPLVGFAGAFLGCAVSTRLMQYFVIRNYPHYLEEDMAADKTGADEKKSDGERKSPFVRILSALLDGGRSGDEGVAVLPWLAQKVDFIFEWLFGFHDPHLVAFPITSLGAVGAALSLVPNFISQGWIDGNAIAVFTAIGMCWSGYLSTHTAMLDSLGFRELTSKAILAHTIGGLCAAVTAHLLYMAVSVAIA